MPDDDQMLAQGTVDFRNEGRRHANQSERLFTPPPKLTERQTYVYALTEHGPLDANQAGVALHLKQRRDCACRDGGQCEWAGSNGREVLDALKRKGLLKRDRHHVYRRTEETNTAQTDDIPY